MFQATPVEIEFSVRKLQAGAVFTFAIDGRDVGTATACTRGPAELEIRIKAAGQ